MGVGEAEKRGGVAGELAPKAKAEDAVHNNPGGGKCGPGGGRGSLGIQHRHLGRQLGKGGFGQGRGRRALDQNNLAGRAPLDQLATGRDFSGPQRVWASWARACPAFSIIWVRERPQAWAADSRAWTSDLRKRFIERASLKIGDEMVVLGA